ncbi:hypothetical protein Poly21_57180 [Allorhodopirellula heiligendammensis]|uniref:Uncharacterized protein n=1 Tax=Allorhodopirellula heiligendammensis TaxID=2714739 RepID=A0A5C6B0E8_9BACT|nr:hypothetical protein Poly21_57180 [Allorhodopirellula heiligendammensis]
MPAHVGRYKFKHSITNLIVAHDLPFRLPTVSAVHAFKSIFSFAECRNSFPAFICIIHQRDFSSIQNLYQVFDRLFSLPFDEGEFLFNTVAGVSLTEDFY